MTTSGSPLSGPQLVVLNDTKYQIFNEGCASILAPAPEERSEKPGPKSKPAVSNNGGKQAVFYNPVQQFNRDLSVLAILAYGEAALVSKSERFARKTDIMRRRKERAGKADLNGKRSNEIQISATDLQVENGSKKRKRANDNVEEAGASIRADEDSGNGSKRARTVDEEDTFEDFDHREVSPADTRMIEATEVAGGKENGVSTAKLPEVRFYILDALSATGLRALRYAKEIPFVTKIIANDLSRSAVSSIELNIAHNGVKDKVSSNVGDARQYMYSKVGNEPDTSGRTIHRFDVIDLDPYGTAVPFLDSAIQALQDGGLLCVTCTDAGVFASNGYPEKSYSLYGGVPLKGVHSHEGGLRLILHAIATSAAKYDIAIEPLLSLSIDFYARLFVRIHKKARDVKTLAGTTMLVYNCDHGCHAWSTQPILRNVAQVNKQGENFFKHKYAQAPESNPLCLQCDTKTHLSGPMWSGPLHNPHFIQRVLQKLPSLDRSTYPTISRIEGMLTVALEENLSPSSQSLSAAPNPAPETTSIPRLPHTVDPTPFFFHPSQLSKLFSVSTPSDTILRSALLRLGYRVTRSHCKPGSIKTDAPWAVVWEVMREWMRRELRAKAPPGGVIEPKPARGTAGWRLLRNLRGSERARVGEIKDGVRVGLAKAETAEEARTVLEAALFRLGKEGGKEKSQDGEAVGDDAGEDDGQAESGEGKKEIETAELGKLDIVFDENYRPKARDICRYQINPRPNWGPMNRAGGV